MNGVKKRWAGEIHAWADGAEIQIRNYGTGEWVGCSCPSWSAGDEYRVKPREFPKSNLPYQTLCDIWNAQSRLSSSEGAATRALRVCADMAVKQYIMDLEKEASQRILRGDEGDC